MSSENDIVIHLIVVGFHHKKGCEIEYCYPTMGDTVPLVWRTLPSLALPDGAHNYDRFSIYFHLPDRDDHNTTIFGISCYRQIDANQLLSKDESVTRGTVQKSVVVLSRVPLYGVIDAKLEMITHAYFGELDFSKVSLLEQTFHDLNSQLNHDLINSSELYFGLSPRQLVKSFRHDIVLLFKLLLLEKKVVILSQKTPVKEVCVSILSLCSLIPGMIQFGLKHSATSVHPKLGRMTSSDLQLSPDHESDQKIYCFNEKPIECIDSINNDLKYDMTDDHKYDDDDELIKEIDEALSSDGSQNSSSPSLGTKKNDDEDTDDLKETTETPPLLKLPLDQCGFPLELFTCGAYCHPYLSISYLDVLADVRVRSCLIGATNFLFKQKRDLFDVIVELDSAKIDIMDTDLKKQLSLTIEDLRFSEHIVKNVIADNGCDEQFEGTNWEGSDEWIRYQFKVYLLHMLRTSETHESSREFSSFNSLFMSLLKETHHYKLWSSVSHPGVFEVNVGHPFAGQMGVNDVRLRLSHAFSGSDTKRLNQTVSRTSKAVGNAVTSAKSAVSNWFTNWSVKSDKSDIHVENKQLEAETPL